MSESEMGLTLPESSLLTRGAGRPNQTQRLEMSPPDMRQRSEKDPSESGEDGIGIVDDRGRWAIVGAFIGAAI